MNHSIANLDSGASPPGSSGPEPAPLGNNTKSTSARLSTRARRYEIQRSIQWIARSEAVQRGMEPYDWQRVSKCRHTRVADDVEVMRSEDTAYYRGIAVCGSVWACPLCAARIQEGRRLEIAAVMAWAYREGFECQMVTFTFPHNRGQALADLLKMQSKALSGLKSGRPFVAFKERVGFQGMVRGLELTHGGNGWHPHTHEIWITKPLDDHDRRYMQTLIRRRWLAQVEKAGIPVRSVRAFFRHAVDFRWQCDTSDYLAKADDASYLNGVDKEVGYSASKVGRESGRHPFQIASDYADKRDPVDAFRFCEYLDAMKGKRQLFFSRGLKARAGLDELLDEDLAGDEMEQPAVIASLDLWSWRAVTDNGLRAYLLDAAETGADALQQFRLENALFQVDRFMPDYYWETRSVVLNDNVFK